MLKNLDKKSGGYCLAIVALAFIALRIPSLNLFDNNWSFKHFEFIPNWYFLIWIVTLIFSVAVFFTYQKSLGDFIGGKFNSRLMGVGLFVLLIIFRFDSFVFGDSNLRINQIANTDQIIIRWFEYGTILLVNVFYHILLKFDFLFNEPSLYWLKLIAAVNAWTIFSFACIMVASVCAFKITHEMSPDRVRRWLLFVIIFFGPQTILYFGYQGMEPVVVAFTYWYALFAIKLSNKFTTNRILMLLFIQIFGVFFHISLLYLLPATVYILYLSLFSRNNSRAIAIILSLATYIGLIVLVYTLASQNFEFSEYILFFDGRNPHTDYGLFSIRHLSDFWQGLLLVFPQFLILLYIIIGKDKLKNIKGMGSATIMSISGLTIFFIASPVNSMPFDLPRLSAYLTPLALTIAMVIKDVDFCVNNVPIFTRLLAVISIFIPLSYIPIYTNIYLADDYLKEYLNKNEKYFLEQSISFRDSYFYIKDMDKANYWELEQPKKSEAYINMQGSANLDANGDHQSALKTLYRLVLEYPYWTEPRALIASINIENGNPRIAKPQIDTCLILEPYNKEHYHTLFLYYRAINNFPEAVKTAQNALQIFNDDTELLIDLMAIQNTIGNINIADSLANQIIDIDPLIAYPYAVKGFISERLKNYEQAIDLYEKFISLAPKDPETPNIRKRLNNLVLKQMEE